MRSCREERQDFFFFFFFSTQLIKESFLLVHINDQIKTKECTLTSASHAVAVEGVVVYCPNSSSIYLHSSACHEAHDKLIHTRKGFISAGERTHDQRDGKAKEVPPSQS